MIPPPPVLRLALPVPAPPPRRTGFPVVATLAPVAVSVALWAVTQSIYSLMFAALGPIVALGGLVDGRFSRRATARRDRERYRGALDGVVRRIADGHAAERARLRGLGIPEIADADRAGEIVTPWQTSASGPVEVHLGTATLVAPVELTGDDPDDATRPVRDELAALRARAAELDRAPLVVDARDGIGIVGPPVVAAALARGVMVQVAAALPPDAVAIRAPARESWTGLLPHDVRTGGDDFHVTMSDGVELQVATASDRSRLPLGCGTILSWQGDAADLLAQVGGASARAVRPLAVSAGRAAQIAVSLTRAADAHGIRPRSALLPTRVELGDLLDLPLREEAPSALAAVVGVDAHGPLVLDLVGDGPHAIVAGTTGSGKSELLVSWVLAMAAVHGPDSVTFLLVDFKGGAAFGSLSALPHVVATLSDLDTRLTRRAILSLRAELLQRERILAEHGARGIDELASGVLARLVIVVDEFAVVVAGDPELHDVFVDLAARGRSLGLHLILCTQRPSGAVRDSVLANIPLRISLRVTDRGDSIAMVGSDAAAQLPAEVRGRAVLADGRGSRDVQIAIASPVDPARVRGRAAGAVARRPWCEPLPTRIRYADLPAADPASAATPGGRPPLAFGVVDLPAEQRQPVAVLDPLRHGHLLVLGTAASGRTTTLEVLAASARRAGVRVARVPDRAADAWAVLKAEQASAERAELVAETPAAPRLLVLDDLDLLASRFDDDYRHEMLDILSRLAREGSARRLLVVASAQRMSGPLASLTAVFGSRLVLRQSSRDEHVLAGADGAAFDPALPAGAGWWGGSLVQVALPPEGEVPGDTLRVPRPYVVDLVDHRVLAIVASRPRPLSAVLRAAGVRVHEVGGADPVADEGLHIGLPGRATVLLGDPESWHGDWVALSRARRELPVVMLGCSASDHRTLLRDRELPPVLGTQPGECWFADGERTRRGVFVIPTPHPPMDSAPDVARNR